MTTVRLKYRVGKTLNTFETSNVGEYILTHRGEEEEEGWLSFEFGFFAVGIGFHSLHHYWMICYQLEGSFSFCRQPRRRELLRKTYGKNEKIDIEFIDT